MQQVLTFKKCHKTISLPFIQSLMRFVPFLFEKNSLIANLKFCNVFCSFFGKSREDTEQQSTGRTTAEMDADAYSKQCEDQFCYAKQIGRHQHQPFSN